MTSDESAAGHSHDGFTIIEVAVALFLLALLFGSIFIPLESRVDMRKVTATELRLTQAREALIGYSIARGHLPCPADESSAGQEPPGTDHATGACPVYYGFLPAAALGLHAPEGGGYALDEWSGPGSRIRYAVSDQTVGPAVNTRAFTRVNGMRTAGIAALGDPALSLIHVCAGAKGALAASCGSAQTVVSTTPAVIWSVGPNAMTGGASADEAQNPNPNGGTRDRIFVMRPRSGTAGSEFDDIVTWVPMTQLIARMVAAGQLP